MKRRRTMNTIRENIIKVIETEPELSLEELERMYSQKTGMSLSIVTALGYRDILDYLHSECAEMMQIESVRGLTTLRPDNWFLKTNKCCQYPSTPDSMPELGDIDDFTIRIRPGFYPISEFDQLAREFGKLNLIDKDEEYDENKIIDGIAENIQILVAEYGKLSSSQISSFYELKFKKPLDLGRYGFPYLRVFFESYPEAFEIDRYWSELEMEIWNSCNGDPVLDKAEPLPPGESTKIYVSKVSNPHDFWYFVRSPKDNEIFDFIVAKMNTFYNHDKSLYLMPIEHIKPNHYCAAELDNKYQRAIVISDVSNNIIKVRNVDSGEVKEVSVNKVRFLLKRFAKLKEQALQGSLSRVEPMKDDWSIAACNVFTSLAEHKELFAYVDGVGREGKSPLILHKNEPKHIDIGEILVNKKYAKYCDK